MLARASSDAGTRLRRSKSTSTVHTHRVFAPEQLDPDVAQRHALAAATTAFVRAQANDVATAAQKRKSGRVDSPGNSSRRSQGSHLARESSLRSLHAHRTEPVRGNSHPSRVLALATEKFPPFHMTSAIEKPRSPQTLTTCDENARPSSQPKPQRPTASSSMTSQQIRKARSMYYASSVQTGSPIARPPVRYLVPSRSASPVPESSLVSANSGDCVLQRPRSSAVSPLASPRLPVTVVLGETVEEARDKYLQTFQQQRQLKHRASLLLAPFKKRQDKPRSRTTTALTGNYQEDPAMTLELKMDDFKPQKEKRSLSCSLKSKLKKAFRRSSKELQPLPIQHIEAHCDYFGNHAQVNQPPMICTRSDIPSPDDETLGRAKSRPSSFGGPYPTFARPSSRNSSQSLYSETDLSNTTTSRVTSWSNSSIGGTLTQREIKRLTVIHEAKDSIGSEVEHGAASNSPEQKPVSPVTSFSAFRHPMPIEGVTNESSTQIDPKRVFSALMKEIDASKTAQPPPHAMDQSSVVEGDIFVSSSTRNAPSCDNKDLCLRSSGNIVSGVDHDVQRHPSHRPLDGATVHDNADIMEANSAKTSSIRSLGRALKSTIRTVTPTGQCAASVPEGSARLHGVVRVPRLSTAGSSSPVDTVNMCRGDGRHVRSLNKRKVGHRAQTKINTPEEQIMTPTRARFDTAGTRKSQDQPETPLEASHVALPLPDKRSSTIANLAQSTCTPKSFDQHKITEKLGQSETEGSIDLRQEPIKTPMKSSRPRPLFSPLSPSVYSRNTDGMSILPNDSVMSLDEANDSSCESGSAVIITSHSVKSYVIGTPTPTRGTEPTHSSKDWKAWLSREVTELANVAREDITIDEHYFTPTGHRRESTQSERDISTASTNHPPPACIGQQMVETKTSTVMEELDAPRQGMTNSPAVIQYASNDIRKPVRPYFSTSNMRGDDRQPHIPRNCSTQSRASWGPKSNDRMNDRFPYIDTGRPSRSNSTGLSRYTPSIAGSGASSFQPSPNPKVNSGLCTTSKHITKCESDLQPTAKTLQDEKEIKKENATPSLSGKGLRVPSSSLKRPKSIQVFASSIPNRAATSLAQYTISMNEAKIAARPKPSEKLARPRPVRSSVSPVKLTVRAKSAVDLRVTPKPLFMSKPLSRPGSESPGKRQLQHAVGAFPSKMPLNGDALEEDMASETLAGMLVETHSPSPKSSPGMIQEETHQPHLHVKHWSSTLELNKEPLPEAEDRAIDTILGDKSRDDFSGRGGSVTPGQRMADRFLKERSIMSGTGSSESDKFRAEPDIGCYRKGSPAFL